MNRVHGIGIVSLLALLFSAAAPVEAQAQFPQRPRRSVQSYDRAYQVGYDEGYRTGYEKGMKDSRDGKSRNPTDFKEYRNADDGYSDRIGNRDEFRLGYRSGFEAGYGDAMTGQQYGARPGAGGRVTVPPGIGRGRSGNPQVLKRGGGRGSQLPPLGRGSDPYGYPGGGSRGNYPDNFPGNGRGGYPGGQRMGFNEMLVIELETPISTRNSSEGDRFFARVVEPYAYGGARVEGYIGKLDKPGRVAGKGEIVLVFQRMIWPDGYSEPMQAQVEEVLGYAGGYNRPGPRGPIGIGRLPYPGKQNDDNDIDAKAGDEGQIEGKGSKGRDTAIVTGGTAVGAAIGGILGGSGGAAVGAAIGAVTGGTVVATNRGHHIDLEPGAQLRIRTGQGVRP